MDNSGLTEYEAEGKLCVHNASLLCVASRCMAWRWAGNDGTWLRRPPSELLTPLPTGFCGLAEVRVMLKDSSDE